MGFYPTKNYQPLVEIGCANSNPLILSDLHVKTLAEHLPAHCDALCHDEHFNVREGDLKMTTSATYKTAILSLGARKNKKSWKLHELRYLSYIFYIVQNQLIKYTEAIPDVMNYVISTISSAHILILHQMLASTFCIISCSKNWNLSCKIYRVKTCLFFLNKLNLFGTEC